MIRTAFVCANSSAVYAEAPGTELELAVKRKTTMERSRHAADGLIATIDAVLRVEYCKWR